jgi:hypothetical protein
MTPYPILNLEDMGLEQQSLEQLGTKAKSWFFDKKEEKQYLFKIGHEDTGENWSEKVACELCRLLGLAHAQYNFAIYKGIQGVLTPSFVVKPKILIHGNQLLHKFRNQQTNHYKQRHHTIGRVFSATGKCLPPEDMLPCDLIKDGADVFVGYLLLDTWIGNTDRHDQNWGVLANLASDKVMLAPTYDHAASLGRELKDQERKDRLSSRDKVYTVAAYAARAKSALYLRPVEKLKALKTMDAFLWFARRKKEAALFWLNKLLILDDCKVREVFEKIPKTHISDDSKDFALELLNINKTRLSQSMREFNE